MTVALLAKKCADCFGHDHTHLLCKGLAKLLFIAVACVAGKLTACPRPRALQPTPWRFGPALEGVGSQAPRFLHASHPRSGDPCLLMLGGGHVYEVVKADLAPPSSWFIDQTVKQGGCGAVRRPLLSQCRPGLSLCSN